MRVQTLTPLQPEYPCLPLPGFQFSLLKTNTSYFKIQKSLMWLDPLTGTGTLLYHAFRNCSHDRSVQPRSVGDTTGPAPGSQLTHREGLCKHSPCMGGGGLAHWCSQLCPRTALSRGPRSCAPSLARTPWPGSVFRNLPVYQGVC